MSITNDLLDQSNTQDEYAQKLGDYAASIHGKEVVNGILDQSPDQDTYITNLQDLVESKKESHIGEFSEENPLIKGAYSLGEKVSSVLDKPRSAILGPAIQAATLGHPIETIKSEFTSLKPQEGSSFVGRAREIFPDQTPIMDPYTKDIAEGEKLKAASKMWLEQKFPKAYGVISNIVPSDVPAMAADVALTAKMPSIPVGKLTSRISSRLEDAAALNREKTLLSEVGTTGSKAAKDVDALKTQKVTNTLDRYGIADKLTNPYELKKALSGETRLGFDSAGNQVPVKIDKGIIGQLGEELRAGSEHLTNKLGKVDIKEIADNVVNKLTNQYSSESSGVAFSPMDAQKLKEQVYTTLKVGEGDNYRDFSSLIDSKRNSAKYYFDLKNDPATPMVAGPSLTNTHKAIWDEIDNFVNEKVPGDPDVRGFARQNSDMSDLLHAEEMLAGARQQSLTTPSLIDIAAGGAIGYGVGNMFGKPEYGALIGGGVGAMKGTANTIRESIPARVGNVQQALSSKISPISEVPVLNKGISAVAPVIMQKGLVENLADYEIPRSSEEVLGNKRLVLAKVAQITNDPKLVAGLDDALNKHPDKVETMLQMLSVQFPNLLVSDKYNRINGKIFSIDPMQKQMMIQNAYKDVENNAGLSNTQKAILWNGLNQDGSLPDSYK